MYIEYPLDGFDLDGLFRMGSNSSDLDIDFSGYFYSLVLPSFGSSNKINILDRFGGSDNTDLVRWDTNENGLDTNENGLDICTDSIIETDDVDGKDRCVVSLFGGWVIARDRGCVTDLVYTRTWRCEKHTA